KKNDAAPENCPELKQVLEAQYALFSRYGYEEDLSSYSASYCLSSSVLGAFRLPRGGKQAIISAMREKISSGTGEIITCDSIESLRPDEGLVNVDVSTQGTLSTLSGRKVIVGTRCPGLTTMSGLEKKRYSFLSGLAKRKNVLHPFTIHLGVDSRSLPESMGDQLIVLMEEAAERSTPIRPFMYVNRHVSESNNSSPAGKNAISLTVMISESPVSLEYETLSALASSMLELLDSCFPFLMEGLESIDIEKSIHESRMHAERSFFGFTAKSRCLLGLPLHDGTTSLGNIYMAGGELAPLLGFDGDVLSGINAARTALGGRSHVYYPNLG
ncbi:MAG: hypothetical protein PHU03_03575, partial [Syntrophales bacterium]|nr:hypothetical protein [Syntrophales bacterium]